MNKSINPSIPPPPTRPNPFVSGTKDCRGAVRGGAPKFRTVGGGGNRRWREETVETETEWKRQTAGHVSVRSCAVVEKALRASVLSGGVSSPPSNGRTRVRVRGGWGGVGREREWMGREEGGEGRGRRRGGGQTRDLVTGVIVNGVNCHLARIGPRNVFMNHDRQAGELSVYEHLNLPPLVKGEIQSKNRGGVV